MDNNNDMKVESSQSENSGADNEDFNTDAIVQGNRKNSDKELEAITNLGPSP